MSEYFPEPKSSRGRVKVELDLFNCDTKADLKNATGVNTSRLAKKIDLAILKSNVDKLDIDQLVPVPVALSKLRDVVKNAVVKKDVYNAKNTTQDVSVYNTKKMYIITTQEYNKLTSENFTARLAQVNLASKSDIANFVKNDKFKGLVMQIEKVPINDRLRVSKVSQKFHVPTIYNFGVIYPSNLLFSLKVAYFLTVSIVFSVYKQNFTV